MNQGTPPDLAGSAPEPSPQTDNAHAPKDAVAGGDKLALLQRAYLLEQLAMLGAGSNAAGDLNKKLGAVAKRELHLDAKTATGIRNDLAQHGYLEVTKAKGKVLFSLTESGRAYLAGLERPVLGGRARAKQAAPRVAKQPAPPDETAITDVVREGQKTYLLLQLLDADGQPLTKGDANRIPDKLQAILALKPALANYRRATLATQGYIQTIREGRTESYVLTPDGLAYLATSTAHYPSGEFEIKGKALNALVAAARESSFTDERPAAQMAERSVPSQSELAEAVMAEFQDLRRERHGSSGLVPIHEVRQRIVERFGPTAGRHDLLDEVILGLWRSQRLGLEGISDLGKATNQQLNDGIPGVSGTLFYLETPREQPVAP
jgi:DNA-binding PadR family transcriptional regulator